MRTEYTAAFYKEVEEGTARAANIVAPFLIRNFKLTRVIDVGCGTGIWLKIFSDHGARDIQGYDGDWVDRAQLRIPAERFHAHDLEQPLNVPEQFDLAISLEVAEHLSEQRADGFVEDLTKLADVVLFSAAIPYQLGTLHINCQWPEYWCAKFRTSGFSAFDCFRPLLWDDASIPYWYKNSMLLYVRTDRTDTLPDEIKKHETCAPKRLVHPDAYLRVGKELRDYISREQSPRYLLKTLLSLLRRGKLR